MIKAVISAIIQFIFPQNITCIICGKEIDSQNTYSMCKDCFDEISFIKEECMFCGKPVINKINISDDREYAETVDEDTEYINDRYSEYETGFSEKKKELKRCAFCEGKRFYFDRAVSCVEYCDKSKKMVFSLKYYGNTYMARYIAEIMKDKMVFDDLKGDFLIYVPLHKKRFRQRGFNQSEKIAQYLSEYTGIPALECIKRNRATKRLYNLDKFEREKELKNVFSLCNEELIRGKHLVLIDDIFTTGATANEISKVLKISGVSDITVLTFLTGAYS